MSPIEPAEVFDFNIHVYENWDHGIFEMLQTDMLIEFHVRQWN